MGQRTTLKILLKSARSVMEDQDAPGDPRKSLRVVHNCGLMTSELFTPCGRSAARPRRVGQFDLPPARRLSLFSPVCVLWRP